jgi:hypothetical protein
MPDWAHNCVDYLSSAFDWTAGHAPIVTAVVAIVAVSIAHKSLHSQRDTARKRAAIDVFFKTEMDEKMLAAHKAYIAGRDAFKSQGRTAQEFETQDRKNYDAVRTYLNVHELIAVGVNRSVFDNDVCYEFWGNELLRAYKDVEPIITEVRKRPDGLETYDALAILHKRWNDRAEKARQLKIANG